jgi:AcrR family transcriptional regulator
VGVGPPALYHCFGSKQHCLFVIMDEAIDDFRARFVAHTAGAGDPLKALAAVLQDCFDLTEQEILLNRMLVAEQGLLATARTLPREEQARDSARARVRELQFEWATCLSRAIHQGAIPDNDPQLLTRAILGLYNSIWQWYRPNGMLPLTWVADFFMERALAMMGDGPERVRTVRMVA